MLWLVWFLLTISCGSSCSEKNGTMLLISESESKHNKQQLRTGCGFSSFKTLNMYQKKLHTKLIESMQDTTPLPAVLIDLTLEYCRAWKGYAKIPTLMGTYFARPYALFMNYRGQECLVTQNDLWRHDAYASDIIRVHDAQTLNPLSVCPNFAKSCLRDQGNFIVSSDDQFIAFIADDQLLYVWDIVVDKLIATQKTSDNSDHNMINFDYNIMLKSFSPDNKIVVGADNDYFIAWFIYKGTKKSWYEKNRLSPFLLMGTTFL